MVKSEIENSFKQVRRDILFPPKLLDELNGEERKEVEKKIVDYCLLGDNASFNYIKHLKTIDLTEAFSDEKMKNLSSTNKALIFEKLYDITKDNRYLIRLIGLARMDTNAYSILTFIYQETKDIYLYQALEKLSVVSNIHKEMFDKRCKLNDTSFHK